MNSVSKEFMDGYLFAYLQKNLAVCVKVITPFVHYAVPGTPSKKRLEVKLLLTDPNGVERVIDWDGIDVEALK